MSALSRDRVRWAISAAAAAILVVLLAVLFRGARVKAPIAPVAPAKPTIALGAGASEEMTMRDLAPLFLPTQFNAAPTTAKPVEPGRAYFEQDPGAHTLFDADDPALRLAPPVIPPATAAAAVGSPPPPLSAGIGRTTLTVPSRPAAGAHVDIYGATDGSSRLGIVLAPDAAPPLTGNAGVRWQPMEFSAAIEAAGLVDTLAITRGSGVEEVDEHFRNYLANGFHLGDRLPPGFYRIVVAP